MKQRFIYLYQTYNMPLCSAYTTVRHVTGNDKDYLRKIPRVVW